MASSSNPDYSFDYDKYGEPTERNRVGSGDMLFGEDYYYDYEVTINGEKYIERRWQRSGQIHRSKDGGSNWYRVK